jgi:hypothetical protein
MAAGIRGHADAWKVLERSLELIASDALWHDGSPNPEALEDIRDRMRTLGYSRKWAHDRAERQDAEYVLEAQRNAEAVLGEIPRVLTEEEIRKIVDEPYG